ncbi:hypothetical protein ACIRVF_39190 [Kitasatospora sp. NPDC101157]|uniref:hypothetical protein n=1 Tax=Kitasatospora sp. NPDC101157 TaxID=3364098 RepID=UPI003821A889
MTSVNTVAVRVRTGSPATAAGRTTKNYPYGSAAASKVIPLWAAPCALVLPAARER